MANKTTSTRVAKIASKLLKDKKSSSATRKVAGSALGQKVRRK